MPRASVPLAPPASDPKGQAFGENTHNITILILMILMIMIIHIIIMIIILIVIA